MGPATSDLARNRSIIDAGLSMDELVGLLSERATELLASQERLRALLEANRLFLGELSPSAVLQRIVDVARDVSAARYAALGLLDNDGHLDRFVQVGLDEKVAAAVEQEWADAVQRSAREDWGTIRRVASVRDDPRVGRISSDPRFTAAGESEAAFNSYLAVPVQVAGTVFGHLWLADRQGGEFTDEDEELVVALAATAGIAIENARLYQESRHRQEWLRARADVARHLSSDHQQQSLQRIADTVLRLARADTVWVVQPEIGSDQVRVVSALGVGADDLLLSTRYRRSGSLADAAMVQGSGLIVGDAGRFVETAISPACAEALGSVMALPLDAEHDMVGAVVVGRVRGRSAFSKSDLDMAESFTAQAAIAMELAEARSNQQRLVLLQDRDRIARDLHDHVVQRLFAIGLSLQSVAATVPHKESGRRLVDLVGDLDKTIREIRTSIFALREDADTETDLRRAVLSARDATTPLLPRPPDVTFVGPLDTLVDSYLIADVEAVVREGLSNVIRHAEAQRTEVRVQASGEELEVRVCDDGRGIGDSRRRSGLDNLRQRAEQYGGSLRIDSEPTRGTTLIWAVPINI